MPTYEYLCRGCGERLEVVQSFSDDPLTVCEACGGELRKVFSAAGLIFKGSGWHVKDYASGGAASGAATSTRGGSATSTDGATTDGGGGGSTSDRPAKDGGTAGAKPDASGSGGTAASTPSGGDA